MSGISPLTLYTSSSSLSTNCSFCLQPGSGEVPIEKAKGIPIARVTISQEEQRQYLESRNNFQQSKTVPSFFDQAIDKASDVIGLGFNSLGNLFSSIRNSVTPPSSLPVGG